MTDPAFPSSEVDKALQARLDRLAARRATTPSAPGPGASRPAGRRRHPAIRSRIAALGLSLTTTAGLGLYFASGSLGPSTGHLKQPAQVIVAAPFITAAPPSTSETTTPSSTAQASTTPATTAPPRTTAPDAAPAIVAGGTYANKWGDVQVQATFAPDGSLSDAVVLQSPAGRDTSVEINNRAVPMLNQEALTAQSANVDTVSGATYTSNDYERSLQSAIDAARTAGITSLA